jgi:transcriptional regulator with XRE-family HTH domain
MSKKIVKSGPLIVVADSMLSSRVNFARNLSLVRKAFGLSYNQLGQAIDGTGAALSDIEKDRTTTTLDRFEKLCRVFSVPPAEFIKKKLVIPKPTVSKKTGGGVIKSVGTRFVYNANLCHNVQTAIKSLGISFIDLAESAGVSPSTVWRIQTNQGVNVSLPIVERLAISLNVNFENLITKKLTKKDFSN